MAYGVVMFGAVSVISQSNAARHSLVISRNAKRKHQKALDWLSQTGYTWDWGFSAGHDHRAGNFQGH